MIYRKASFFHFLKQYKNKLKNSTTSKQRLFLKIHAYWDVMPYWLVNSSRHFRGSHCLIFDSKHSQGQFDFEDEETIYQPKQ